MPKLADLIPDSTSSKGSTPLIQALIFFVVIFTFSWVILYSFSPSIVCMKNPNRTIMTHDDSSRPIVDKGKCVVGSMLIALLVVLGIWLSRNLTC
jgi:hypothetical protein